MGYGRGGFMTIGQGLMGLGAGLSRGLQNRWENKRRDDMAEGLIGPMQRSNWVEKIRPEEKKDYRKKIGILAGAPNIDAMYQAKMAGPQDQELMQVGKNIYDPNSRQWITPPEKEEAPDFDFEQFGDTVYRTSPDGTHEEMFKVDPRREVVFEDDTEMVDGIPTTKRVWKYKDEPGDAWRDTGLTKKISASVVSDSPLTGNKTYMAKLAADTEVMSIANDRYRKMVDTFDPSYLTYFSKAGEDGERDC